MPRSAQPPDSPDHHRGHAHPPSLGSAIVHRPHLIRAEARGNERSALVSALPYPTTCPDRRSRYPGPPRPRQQPCRSATTAPRRGPRTVGAWPSCVELGERVAALDHPVNAGVTVTTAAATVTVVTTGEPHDVSLPWTLDVSPVV